MRRIIYKIGAGLVLSFFSALIFSLIGGVLSDAIVTVNLGGDKAGPIWGIIFGMPLGSVIGFLLIDKIFYQFEKNNILGMTIGFLCGFAFGGIGGLFLLDLIGGKAILLIPLLTVCFCLTGYQIGLRNALR
ncbi:MAG: hypothetical protein ACXWMS_13075 [Syntrophales bacterium]